MIIAFEGLDGSGKSSQAKELYRKLTEEGYNVILSPWRRGKGIVDFLKEMCTSEYCDARDGSLAFAAEYWTRWDEDKKYENSKDIIIYDRYIYTEIARGVARGITQEWLNLLYRNAIKPDITFFIQCNKEDLYNRKKDSKISLFEAGLDSMNEKKEKFNEVYIKYDNGEYDKTYILKCFCEFQEKQLEAYKELNDYKEFFKLDSSRLSIEDMEKIIYREVIKKIELQ